MQHFHFVAFEGRSSWSSRAATCPCFSGAQHLLCELSVLDAVHLQKFHMPGGCSLPHESQKFSLELAQASAILYPLDSQDPNGSSQPRWRS